VRGVDSGGLIVIDWQECVQAAARGHDAWCELRSVLLGRLLVPSLPVLLMLCCQCHVLIPCAAH
jgi:hypothetical protein